MYIYTSLRASRAGAIRGPRTVLAVGGPLARACSWSVGPSRLLGADRHSVLGHHHVRVVALEGEGVAHGDLRFARGAHRDLGRSRKDLRAREASRAFGGGGTQGARSDQDGLAVALGAGVRDLRTVSCRIDLRDVVGRRRAAPRRRGALTINAEYSLFSRHNARNARGAARYGSRGVRRTAAGG